MIYTLRFSHPAAAYFDQQDRPTKERIERALIEVATDPLGPASKRMAGVGGLRSAREGDYRIVFDFDAPAGIVDVLRIGPRGRVYRGL